MINVPQEIKDILHQDTCPKNIRIHFPNGERTDICNDLIVMDSVSFKESLCSQNSFMFGLAESPIFECEVAGVSNIKGATIEVSCEIYCPNTVSGAVWRVDIQQYVYPIPYGTFVVRSCERQADLLHRKILAYNGLAAENWSFSLNELFKLSVGSNSDADEYKYKPFIPFFLYANNVNVGYMFDKYGPYTMTNSDSYLVKNDDMKFKLDDTDDYYTVELTVYCKNDDLAPAGLRDITVGDFSIAEENYRKMAYNMKTTWHIPSGIADYFVSQAYGKLTVTNARDNLSNYMLLSEYTLYPLRIHDVGKDGIKIVSSVPTSVYMSIYRHREGVKTNYDNFTFVIRDASYCKYWNYGFKDEYAYTQDFTLTFDNYKANDNKYYTNILSTDIQKVIASYCEIMGRFGRFNNNGEFVLISAEELFGLTPSDTLYPNDNLKPLGVTGGSILPQDYQSCWYDDHYTLPYGKIELDANNLTFNYWINGFDKNSSEDEYQIYRIKDNLILNSKEWQVSVINQILARIAESISNVIYMPVKLVSRGLPYVEPGDTFEVLTTSGDSITTIVLSRTLKGEMVLTDEYVSVT